MSAPISVLVVDDSAFMRKVITDMLSQEDGIVVVGQARDGFDAVEKAGRLRPDVITLDVEMPGLDGVATLKRILMIRPTPVVMLSSRTQSGADVTMRCLESGAVDFVAKPSGAISLDIRSVSAELVVKVKAAARFGRRRMPIKDAASTANSDGACFRTDLPASVRMLGCAAVVVIGASTGGPAALQALVASIPADLHAPIVIVQHMPAVFTAALAKRLDAGSDLTVREASEGDHLQTGVALVAPGGRHLSFDIHGAARLTDEPPAHGVRPAADVTIASLAGHFREGVVAVLLTGMGKDGARGLKIVSDAGGATIAQDEATCVVYGMPRAAVELGAAQQILPLHEIGAAIVRAVGERQRSRAA